jgi:hypothetical protein
MLHCLPVDTEQFKAFNVQVGILSLFLFFFFLILVTMGIVLDTQRPFQSEDLESFSSFSLSSLPSLKFSLFPVPRPCIAQILDLLDLFSTIFFSLLS